MIFLFTKMDLFYSVRIVILNKREENRVKFLKRNVAFRYTGIFLGRQTILIAFTLPIE